MAGHDEIDNTSSQHVTDRHTNNADTITSLFVGGCKLTLMQCEDFTVEGLIGNNRVKDNLEDKGNVMADIIALYSCNSQLAAIVYCVCNALNNVGLNLLCYNYNKLEDVAVDEDNVDFLKVFGKSNLYRKLQEIKVHFLA